MGMQEVYTLPVDQTGWSLNGEFETIFNWEYDEIRSRLLTLYSKGKQKQWDAEERIDWSIEVDPENALDLGDEYLSIYGSDVYERMTDKERRVLKQHFEAWRFSQFLHGEQGALICAAKIVQTVPEIDSKFYAATQVIDEARHVETYSRFLREKIDLAYPINDNLRTLLEWTITDSRWDITYLGMQILIEGLALAAFGLIRDMAQNRLAAAINAYVMQDEARHVAFGRLSLRDYYKELTQAERDEREEFVVEACYRMRDRFLAEEMWERLGLPVDECIGYIESSPLMTDFRKLLFTRIVPTIRDIGLWGDKVRGAYADMGVMDFAEVDPGELSEADERVADDFDRELAGRRQQVAEVIALEDDTARLPG